MNTQPLCFKHVILRNGIFYCESGGSMIKSYKITFSYIHIIEDSLG